MSHFLIALWRPSPAANAKGLKATRSRLTIGLSLRNSRFAAALWRHFKTCRLRIGNRGIRRLLSRPSSQRHLARSSVR